MNLVTYERLQFHLRRFPKDSVRNFMEALVVLQVNAEEIPQSRERIRDLKQLMKAIESFDVLAKKVAQTEWRNDFRNASTKAVVAHGGIEVLFRTLAVRPESDAPPLPPLASLTRDVAVHAKLLKQEIAKEIDRSMPTRRGRKRVDSDGTLTSIAAAYKKCFGTAPSSTEGGTFYNVAAEILGNEKNVQRWVLTAVAAVRKSK